MGARTLVAVLVYGGRDYVPACLESAARLPGLGDEVDVLILDDCSPDAQWSIEVRDRCAELGLGYYRSPHNIGIPRNMSLALRRGDSGGYDHVVIANSDVLFPANLVSGLVAAAEGDPTIASVTAWSNSVSSFSLVNHEPATNLASLAATDRISALLDEHFRGRTVDIPVGVGFCMLVPTSIARRVGLLDPIFGRGYCEEVDWCLRAHAMGLRNVLAPGVFVYHIGSATTKEIGLLQDWQSSVPAHDAIIDLRYPEYRAMLGQHHERAAIARICREGEQVLVLAGAREDGYVVELSELFQADVERGPARFVVDPARPSVNLRALHGGFAIMIDVEGGDVLATLERNTGRKPTRVVIRDRGPVSDRLADEARAAGVLVDDAYVYPQAV